MAVLKFIIRWFLLLILYWFLIFFIGRISFYACLIPLLEGVPLAKILQSLYTGLRLDLSTIGYLISLSVVLFSLYLLRQKKLLLSTIDSINYVFIIIYVLTFVGEACVYREWKAKLSMQALQHFMHPSEVFKTTSTGLTFLFFGLSAILIAIFLKIYQLRFSASKIQFYPTKSLIKKAITSFLFLIVGLFFSVICIRGGFQAIPIQSSDAFFCTTPIVNDAAVNPFWNIAYNIIDYENRFKNNPYSDFELAEAQKIVKQIYDVPNDSSIQLLNTQRPNIVFIILESWNAHVIKSFGGDNFSPFIDSLSKQGISFTKFYPAGYVSDQGIPAILSGYPAVSRISIINQSSKSAKLPCINQDLKEYGYQSGFLFGGDLNYGNIKSYIYNKSFDVVKEEKDIEARFKRGKLGIQDNDMAEIYLSQLNQAKTPFIYAWFTLSTHMPYDFPGKMKSLVNHKENEFINSITFADQALKSFFSKAQFQDWYKNTLFVLVADHSHSDHTDQSVYNSEYHRIPMIFFGDVIKSEFRGKKVNGVFSQLDITKTLLNQLGLRQKSSQYIWSKDIFNPNSKHIAYFSSFAGGGVVTDSEEVGYQHGLKELVVNTCRANTTSDSLLRYGKAFQQVVFEDYRLK